MTRSGSRSCLPRRSYSPTPQKCLAGFVTRMALPAGRAAAPGPPASQLLRSSPGTSTIGINAGEAPVAREQRKLAAILAAVVVGYCCLMGRDESGTLTRLQVVLTKLWPVAHC